MVLVRFLFVAWFCVSIARAEFTITVANPVAARIPTMKKVAMAVRAEGCADPAQVQLKAIAVRLEAGSRVSVPVAVVRAEQPGVFAIGFATSPGTWSYVLTAECRGSSAGSIVFIDDRGLLDRARTRTFPHAPTDAEIGAALQ